ncbi:MAG TPA: thioredoxin domain-containing protein [Vicinamibacteria bacterium]|jgi:protein-disulfide isomerase
MTRRAVLACALSVVALAATARPAEKSAAPRRSTVVASVEGVTIDAAELEAAGGARLFTIYTQEYQLRKQLLDDIITKRLLDKEAKTRGISADELSRVEVEGKAQPVTEAEVKAFYDQNKGRFGQTAEADALKQIESGLRQQRINARRTEYVAGLRKAASVKVMLEPPRIKVDPTGGPARGPESAPITIIEYADYQCPYCTRANAALKQVEEHYAGKVRIVFRDFPLTQIHANAAKAAEAGACANEQGKFWPMHDRLFANQTKLAVPDLKQHASELGLDAAAFETCLDSGKHAADVKKSLEEGQRLGLSGTPSFFINGRLLVGAQPYEGFAQVIDEELEQTASAAEPAASRKKSEP